MTEWEKEDLLDRFKRHTGPEDSIESLADRLAEYAEMIYVGLGEAEDRKVAELGNIIDWAIKWYVGAEDDEDRG